MGYSIEQLTRLCKDELELCGVKPNEKIVIACQGDTGRGFKDAFIAAASMLDAIPFSVEFPGAWREELPQHGRQMVKIDQYITEHPYVMETLKQADIVIDITGEGLVHTKARAIIVENGARMLMVWEHPEILERMFPRRSLRKRVEKAAEMIDEAKTFRVTSKSGTDISMELDKPRIIQQYGYTDKPGRWDHFAGGFVAFYPVDRSPTGKIVIDCGDIIIPMNRYVENPITVTIDKGFITDIYGEGLDTKLFKGYLDSWRDQEAFATSHFGFGLDETASWEAMQFYGKSTYGMDARAYAGNFMWSTGPDAGVGRFVRSHYDIPMLNCSVYLDNQVVVNEGEIVIPELIPYMG
ncbi:hypothetical protein [Salipaludibacillus sp. CF4.18]|uniref:hypothetical protein n=1 Tax=Salipaludibacillus sp. CF4.18 TaxID=3373081 RepID=UPI003EE62C05